MPVWLNSRFIIGIAPRDLDRILGRYLLQSIVLAQSIGPYSKRNDRLSHTRRQIRGKLITSKSCTNLYPVKEVASYYGPMVPLQHSM